jgi:hypothetical protein
MAPPPGIVVFLGLAIPVRRPISDIADTFSGVAWVGPLGWLLQPAASTEADRATSAQVRFRRFVIECSFGLWSEIRSIGGTAGSAFHEGVV